MFNMSEACLKLLGWSANYDVNHCFTDIFSRELISRKWKGRGLNQFAICQLISWDFIETALKEPILKTEISFNWTFTEIVNKKIDGSK